MTCPDCEHENPPNSRFCERCGARHARRCVACDAALTPEARFCNSCGAPQEAAPVGLSGPGGSGDSPGEVAEVTSSARAMLTPSGPVPIPSSARITAPLLRGVYFLRGAGTDTVGAVQVNHDPRESRLARAETRVLRSTLGGDVQVLSDQGLDRELFRGARRADLAGGILVLAILIALVEFALSSAGGAAGREL